MLIIYIGSSFCQPFKESLKCLMEMPDFSDMAGMGRAFRIHRQLISPNRLFVSFFVVVVCVCVYFILFFLHILVT